MATSTPTVDAVGTTKNPDKIKAGKGGARARWGEAYVPRAVVRIDQLTAEQRRLVLALVNAAKAEAAETETRS